MRCGDQLVSRGWVFYWIVKVPVAELVKFRAGVGRCGDPLVEYGNQLLECTLKKLKPAHTDLFFLFGS